MVGGLYVCVAQEAAVEVGVKFGWEVELLVYCVFGDPAVEVVFDRIFGCVAAAEEAFVTGVVAFLESPVSAPSVPQGAEGRGGDSGRGESLQELQAGKGPAGLPCRSVLLTCGDPCT